MTTPIPPAVLEAATQGEMKVHRDQTGLITLYVGSLSEKQIADMTLVGAGQGGAEEELANAELLAASWNVCRRYDIAKLQAAADALPGLAAALENLLTHCETYFNIGEVGGKEAEIVEAARAAIAKAKGGAQ